MIDAVGSALSNILSWFGSVISSIVNPGSSTTDAGALHALLPVFALSIGVALVYAGIKLIRRLTYGA